MKFNFANLASKAKINPKVVSAAATVGAAVVWLLNMAVEANAREEMKAELKKEILDEMSK